MSNAKNQHYLARVFLKHFADRRGHMVLFDKQKEVTKSQTIKKIAVKTHLYTIDDGKNKNFSVENAFSKIEDSIEPLLSKIALKPDGKISDTQLAGLIEFIVITFSRTPDHVDVADEILTDPIVLKEIEGQIDKHGDEARKFFEEQKRTKGLSYARTLPFTQEDRYNKLIHNFDPVFLIAPINTIGFALNDRYSCLEIREQMNIPKEDFDWSSANIVCHFPLNKRLCLSFFPKEDRSMIGTKTITLRPQIKVNDYNVNFINILTVHQAKRYAFYPPSFITDICLN